MDVWIELGGIETGQLVQAAVACEQAGIAGVSMSDHLVLPARIDSEYPYSSAGSFEWASQLPWPDAWVAIGAMAAATSTLRLATAVYVAPLRRPLSLAKAVSTAAVISGGRVVCGIGAGWMPEEFAAAGEDFASRGARLDETIEILRLVWSGDAVGFEGEHYRFEPVRMLPSPAAPVPIWIGGNTPAAMRRASGQDGWICAFRDLQQALADRRRLDERRMAAGAAAGDGFETAVVGPFRKVEVLEQLAEGGFDTAIVPLAVLGDRRPGGDWRAAVERAGTLATAVRDI